MINSGDNTKWAVSLRKANGDKIRSLLTKIYVKIKKAHNMQAIHDDWSSKDHVPKENMSIKIMQNISIHHNSFDKILGQDNLDIT